MKRGLLLTGSPALVLAILSFAAVALAQHLPSTASPAKLDAAVALLNQGQPQAARAVLATIAQKDASYGQAKAYDALCLYALADGKRFLKAAEAPEIPAASLPESVREDLDYKRISALFLYRRFDELLPRLAEYQADHPDSVRLPAMAEYQMAGLYERGMKKVYEAGICGNNTEFAQHWLDGQSNLVQFLNQAAALDETNYQTLPDRELKQEMVTALTALGNDNAVALVPPANREETGFLSLKLYWKLQPKAVDDNLQRMTNFLNNFPKTKYRKRVLFDMANISFSCGEACMKAAEAASRAGDIQGAATNRAQGLVYFRYTRSLTNQFYVDAAAGIDAADVFDRQDDFLNSYYSERDYGQLIGLAATAASNSAPGSPTRMLAKNYLAIGLAAQAPADPQGAAAAALEEVLAAGFNGRADHDHLVLSAARWRIYLALQGGIGPRAVQIVQWVQASNCHQNQKAAFLKAYAYLLKPVNAK